MEQVRQVDRPRRRSQLGVMAVILITIVGAIVWERSSAVASTPPVSAVATTDPLPVSLALVKIGTTTVFVKNVQGLTIVEDTGYRLDPHSEPDLGHVLRRLDEATPQQRRRGGAPQYDNHLPRFGFARGAESERDRRRPVSMNLSPIDGTNPVQETLKLSYTDIAPA